MLLLTQPSNFIPFHNPQLQPTAQLSSSASAISLCAKVSNCFTKKNVWGTTLEIPQHLRVVLSIYEPAWDLVNKCLRNTFTQQLPTCFPPFPLTFPHISRRVPYVSSGISYVSLYFLFYVLRSANQFLGVSQIF